MTKQPIHHRLNQLQLRIMKQQKELRLLHEKDRIRRESDASKPSPEENKQENRRQANRRQANLPPAL